MSREPTERRAQILEVAERLFRHYGPGKTTIADIARACGIGVGSVYLDFPSKEAIVDELTRDRSSRIVERMRAAARSRSSAERIVEMLRARVDALFDLAADGQHASDLVRCGRSGFEPDVRALLAEAVREGHERRELRGPVAVDGADRAVELVELAFASLSPPAVFRFDRASATTRAEQLARVVVYGLAASSVRVRSGSPKTAASPKQESSRVAPKGKPRLAR